MIRTFSNNYDGFKLLNYIYDDEIFLLKCAVQNFVECFVRLIE